MSNGYGIGRNDKAPNQPQPQPKEAEKPKNVVDLIREKNKKLKEAAGG